MDLKREAIMQNMHRNKNRFEMSYITVLTVSCAQ